MFRKLISETKNKLKIIGFDLDCAGSTKKKNYTTGCGFSFWYGIRDRTRTNLNAARMSAACRQLDGGNTMIKSSPISSAPPTTPQGVARMSKEIICSLSGSSHPHVFPSQCAHWRGNPLQTTRTAAIGGDCHTSDIGHWLQRRVERNAKLKFEILSHTDHTARCGFLFAQILPKFELLYRLPHFFVL